jgi:hypothetical protein
MVYNYPALNNHERMLLIVNQEEERNSLVYRLEQSCIGRLILNIFCCLRCYDTSRTRWKDHRKFLLNEQPPQTNVEAYQLWLLATQRVNRFLPYRRPLEYGDRVRVVHQPVARPTVFDFPAPQRRAAPTRLYTEPLNLNVDASYRPKTTYAPAPQPMVPVVQARPHVPNPVQVNMERGYKPQTTYATIPQTVVNVVPRQTGNYAQVVNPRPDSVRPGTKRTIIR